MADPTLSGVPICSNQKGLFPQSLPFSRRRAPHPHPHPLRDFSGVIDFVLAFMVLLGIMLFYGIVVTINVICLPLLLLLAALWVSRCGEAAMNVQFRDVRYTGMMHASGQISSDARFYCNIRYYHARAAMPTWHISINVLLVNLTQVAKRHMKVAKRHMEVAKRHMEVAKLHMEVAKRHMEVAILHTSNGICNTQYVILHTSNGICNTQYAIQTGGKTDGFITR